MERTRPTMLLVCVTCRRANPVAAAPSAVEPAGPAGSADTAALPLSAAPGLTRGLDAEVPGAGIEVPGQARDSAGTAAPVRPGATMLDRLASGDLPSGMRLRGVECLSACSSGCAVALTGPGRWTYVYGNLDPAEHPAEILAGAAAYAATDDGLVPWRERPLVLRRNVIARVPPFELEPT